MLSNLAVSHQFLNILLHSSPIKGGSNLLVGAKEPRVTPSSCVVELIKQNRNPG